jgi:uncharacterized protein (DUF433 family)
MKVQDMEHGRVRADDLVGVGLYSVSETARVLSHALGRRIESKRLHRWSHGRRDRLKLMIREYAPVIGVHLKVGGSFLFTFSDLIELFTVAALRYHDISLQTIRLAYQRACELYGDHPFAKQRYCTDGSGIFPSLKNHDGNLEELSRGQLAFEQIVRPLLKNVSYSGETATMFSPLGVDRTVVLDPGRAFGSPINKDSGVPTQVLYEMHQAGESDEDIASWYGVPLEGVRDAVEYETALSQVSNLL